MNPVGTPTVHGRGQRARRLAAPRRVRFICQVFSPDLSSHTFRPPPVAATDIRVESTSSWQPPCSATANLAQATLHDVPMARDMMCPWHPLSRVLLLFKIQSRPRSAIRLVDQHISPHQRNKFSIHKLIFYPYRCSRFNQQHHFS